MCESVSEGIRGFCEKHHISRRIGVNGEAAMSDLPKIANSVCLPMGVRGALHRSATKPVAVWWGRFSWAMAGASLALDSC